MVRGRARTLPPRPEFASPLGSSWAAGGEPLRTNREHRKGREARRDRKDSTGSWIAAA
jgi:hypothetical protein